MSSTTPSPRPPAPTERGTLQAKVTVQAAIVATWTVELQAGDADEARRAALEHPFREEWDSLSESLARAMRTAAGDDVTAYEVTSIIDGAPRLLVRRGHG